MSKSLQEQLVQAGLATTEQAERKSRKPDSHKPDSHKPKSRNRKSGKRGKSGRVEAHARQADRGRKAPQGTSAGTEASPKRESGTAAGQHVSNRQRKRELAARVEAVVSAHGLQRAQGEVPYRFTRGSRIKETWVSPAERDALARGDVALIGLRGRYALLPAEHVASVRDIDPAAVLVAVEPGAGHDAEDEYPVPDDLVW